MGPEEKTGIVRNISFSNIRATVVHPYQLPDLALPSGYRTAEVKSCISLNGVGAFIENVTFDNFHATFPGGGTAEEAAVRDVPKIVGEYFETGTLPAHALYARNVRGLTMSNVRFEVAAEEARPSMIFDTVEDAAITSLTLRGTREAESLLRFINTREILLTAPRVLGEASTFLQAEGKDCAKIIVDGGDLSNASAPVVFKSDAPEQSVKIRA
jgi:hypothetical protein